MHYNSLASREREEKGCQMEPTGTKTKPNGTHRGAKRTAKLIQNGARMKKAPPKAPFAEQERTSWEKGCEEDDNVC